MKTATRNILVATALLSIQGSLEAFTPNSFGIHNAVKLPTSTSTEVETSITHSNYEEESTTVRAPLKFVGPYPSLGLRFPELATKSQKSRNVTGVSLDFVLDTAANTNTINAQVVGELGLEVVGAALPGVGSAGAISGGSTYMLGDSQLDGVGEAFTFMQGLTASALPIASPTAAGLLSLAFFNCFEGGVEFDWGSEQVMEDGMPPQRPPSITFYGQMDNNLTKILDDMTRVPIQSVPVTNLPSVTIKVNGIEMTALLDTGSPITVLNKQAAQQSGIETVELPSQSKETKNPFAAIGNRFKEAQATAQAAARGDVLTIAGTQGRPVNLLKSTSKARIALVGDLEVSFGDSHVYVGDIPGLAALSGIGVQSPPTVVLGMDILRCRPKMLLRVRDNEVYF
jgi:hypothetical protein